MELDFGTCAAIALVLVILAILMTGRRKKEEVIEEAAPVAPYKVETPAVAETVEAAPVALPVEGAGTVEVPAKPARKPRAPKVGATTAAKAKAADKKPAAKAKAPAKKAPAKKTK